MAEEVEVAVSRFCGAIYIENEARTRNVHMMCVNEANFQ